MRRKRQPSDETIADDARLAGLLRRGRRAERSAYRVFLTELSGRLRWQMRARAGGLGEADIEDLVQEVLLSVHASRATWDETKPVLPWIAAIARYRLADHLRRRRRAGRLVEEASAVSETFSGSVANRTAEEVVNAMSMGRALKGLSETERRAFTLVRLKGLSLDEAAGSSGSTVSAIKVAVHRAARKLQALVGDGSL
jgi:RNA polymerase sigma factor (sigma-70 family)